MKLKRGISVCGVGGKSTVSAMIAVILEKAGLDPAFAVGVGSIPAVGMPGKWGKGKWFIAEADEYTTSPQDATPKMSYQHPEIIVLPNLEFDHPDVYRDLAATQNAFLAFLNRLPQDGVLVAGIDNPHVRDLLPKVKRPIVTYGFHSQADWQLEEPRVVNQCQQVMVRHGRESIGLALPIPGRFNAANAVAALVVAARVGVTRQKIIDGLSQFTGTKRRFEKIAQVGSTLLYDDYAHHPLELGATLAAAKSWLPGKKILAIFQPHTYSRTKALLNDFALSFSDADTVVVTDIYASARETEDLGMSGEMLAAKIKAYHKRVEFCPDQEAVLNFLKKEKVRDTAIFTLGAGDIFLWHKAIRKVIEAHD
jgi:UDP-N-acetylmuramate--alanine ligase